MGRKIKIGVFCVSFLLIAEVQLVLTGFFKVESI